MVAPGNEPTEPALNLAGPEHSVLFYREDAALVQSVAEVVTVALVEGAAAVIVATAPHRDAIWSALRTRGHDVDALVAAGTLIGLDAAATLQAICIDGMPDAARFDEVVGATIRAAIEPVPARRVRAFGEMVDLLWRSGNTDGPVRLEEIWQGLLARTPVDLMCAYRVDGFASEKDAYAFREICRHHGEILPAPELAELPPGQLSRTVASLEDRADTESAYRELLKKERAARDRMVRLQQVTASLSKALTASDIADIGVTIVTDALGATVGSLSLLSVDGATIESYLSPERVEPAVAERFRVLPSDGGTRISLPLFARGVAIGAMNFLFPSRNPLSDDERSFMLAVAEQCAQALERARLYETERRARELAEAGRAETTLLFRLSAAVNSAQTLDEVFEPSLAMLCGALHVDRAAILLRDAAGTMRFRAWRGLSDDYRRAVDGHSPWRPNERDPQPVLVADTETDPTWEAYRPIFRAEGIRALGFVPLLDRRTLYGKLMVYDAEPRVFGKRELELTQTIAAQIAQAVARARLFEAEKRARLAAEAAHERTAFLLEASAILSSSLRFGEALERVAQLAVPRAADGCIVELVGEDGVTETLGVRPPNDELAAELRRRSVAVMNAGAPDLVDPLTSAGVGSAMIVPISARGRCFGAISIVAAESGRHYDRVDLEMAELLGRRAAIAIDNALLFAAEARSRAAAERHAERMARLQEMAAALSRLAAPDEVAAAVVAHGCAALRASSGALWLVDGAGQSLELVTARGPRAAAADRFRTVRLDSTFAVPILDAVRGAETIWLETRDEVNRRYPEVPARVAPAGAGMVAVPLLADGRPIGAIVLAFDEGRRIDDDDRAFVALLADQAAQSLQRARLYAVADAASRAREQVLAIVSHDLRNPLGAVMIGAAHIHTLSSLPENKRIRKAAETIQRSATRMSRLIDDLLDFAGIQAGRLAVQLERHSTRELVDEAIEAFAAAAAERGLELVAEVPSPPPEVICDRDRIVQVLSNLLANAVKVTAVGGRIVVSVEEREDEIAFVVSDTGPGIAADDLPHLFERYWRSKDAGYEGTGLGLAIAKGIVEAHGGRISVESRIGVGTTFTFLLRAR